MVVVMWLGGWEGLPGQVGGVTWLKGGGVTWAGRRSYLALEERCVEVRR